MYPTLLILPNLFQTENEFRRQGFQIINVDTPDEARQAVSDLKGVGYTKKPIVLSDVGRLRSRQAILLKFLEETSLRVILLSSQDNLRSTLLSRMKRVVKTPEIIPCERDDPKVLRDLIDTEDGKVDMSEIARQCPSLSRFLFHFRRSRLPVRNKLLDLVLGDPS